MPDWAEGARAACHAALSPAPGAPPGGLFGSAAVLLVGLLGTLMPCTVQMTAVLGTLLAPEGQPGKALGAALWLSRVARFMAAYGVTFLAAAGAAAILVRSAGWATGVSSLQILGGLVLAGFGAQVLGWMRLPGGGPCAGPVGFFLGRSWRATPSPERMGLSFAFYCAGCCGPAAIGSAILITGGRSAGGAAVILLAYAAGMAIPFVVLAAGLAFALESLKRILRFIPAMSAAGGAVAVIAGALLALEPLTIYLAG